MNDSISRQSAIDEANAWLLDCLKVNKQDRSCGLIRRLEDLPSAQPEPKRGKWESQSGGGYCCSECGRYAMDKADGRIVMISVKSKFCPNCGANMRKDGENSEIN